MRLSSRTEIVGLVGLMVGFGLARLTTSPTMPLSAPATAPAQPPAPASADAEPPAVDPAAAPPSAAPRASSLRSEEPTWERIADLERQVAELLEQTADLSEQLEQARRTARTRATLPSTIPTGMGMPAGWGGFQHAVLRPDLALDPAAVALLDLSEADTSAVEAAVRNARSALDRLETAHARVTEQTDTSVTVSIEPFEEDGERIREELRVALATTLGDDRGARLLEQLVERAQAFSHFGEATQTLTATRAESGQYRLQTTQKVENNTGGMSHSTSIRVADDLPASVAHLIELP